MRKFLLKLIKYILKEKKKNNLFNEINNFYVFNLINNMLCIMDYGFNIFYGKNTILFRIK